MRFLLLVQSPLANDSRVLRHLHSLLERDNEVTVISFSAEETSVPSLDPARFIFISAASVGASANLATAQILVWLWGALVGSLALVSMALDSVAFVPVISGLAMLAAVVGYRLHRNRATRDASSVSISRYFVWLYLGVFGLLAKRFVSAVVASRKPDFIHIHDLLPLLGLPAPRYHDPETYIVWDAHELYHHQQGNSWLWKHAKLFVLRSTLARVQLVFTVSEGVKRQYLEDFRAFPTCLVVANASSAQVVRRASPRLKQQVGLDPRQRILLFQGGLSAGRGIPLLLDLAPLLDPQWALVFMGRGPFELEVERAVKEYPGRVFLIPPVPPDELAEMTSGADLGAIPYEDTNLNHRNAAPNKIWEYSVAGVPILARNLPELARFVEGNGIGIVFRDHDSPTDVATKINSLTPRDLAELSERAKFFASHDNWEKYESRMFSAYSHLLDRTQPLALEDQN